MTKDKRPDTWPELPLMRGGEVMSPRRRDYWCGAAPEAALSPERRASVFLYLPHTMPGSTAQLLQPAFRGKSRNGNYDSVGTRLEHRRISPRCSSSAWGKTRHLESDSSTVQRNPPQGSNFPYRWGYDERRRDAHARVMRWPGVIPAGRVGRTVQLLDLLPTLALAGAPAGAND